MKAIPINYNKNKLSHYKSWIVSVLLLPVMVYLLLNEGRIFLVDYVNLLIHEGGHGILGIFGVRYLHALGGTIMQLLIPVMFVVYYYLHSKKIPTQIFLVWLGQNIINVSVYAADARAQKLPLLGGNKVYHDWNYLLSEIGLLEYDNLVGLTFYLLAIGIFIISILMPLLLRDYKQVNINLNL